MNVEAFRYELTSKEFKFIAGDIKQSEPRGPQAGSLQEVIHVLTWIFGNFYYRGFESHGSPFNVFLLMCCTHDISLPDKYSIKLATKRIILGTSFCAVILAAFILSADILNKLKSNERKKIITDHKEHETINLMLLYDKLKA